MSANAAIFNPTESTSAATGDGFSCPRLTTTGRLAISFGVNDKGMMVFDTTLNNLFIWNGTAWESVPAAGDSSDTQVIFNDNGNLAGDPGLLYQKSLQRLTVGTNVDIWRGGLNDGTSTAVGNRTLELTAAGAVDNTAIGYRSMYRALTAAGNTAIGSNALSANFMTGNNNVAVGINSLNKTSTGSANTAIGYQAGVGVTTGNYNIFAGADAGNAAAITGTDNVGIGRDTFRNLSSGSDNVAVGRNALYGVSSGSNNTAVGTNALLSNTASGNVAVGINALFSNTTGANHTAVGFESLKDTVSNSNCTALGYFAGRANTAADVTAIGANALALGTTGVNNTAVGSGAMALAVTTGAYNTAIGTGAGANLTSGASNVIIGNDCASTTTTGGSNICIGVGTRTSTNSISNEFSIGSSTTFVATNGGATTYFAFGAAGGVALPATCSGAIRIYLNGTFVKIPVYPN